MPVLTGLHAAPPVARWSKSAIRGIVARNWPHRLAKLPPKGD